MSLFFNASIPRRYASSPPATVGGATDRPVFAFAINIFSGDAGRAAARDVRPLSPAATVSDFCGWGLLDGSAETPGAAETTAGGGNGLAPPDEDAGDVAPTFGAG